MRTRTESPIREIPSLQLNVHPSGRLAKLGQLILDNAQDLAQLESRDAGKPLTVARKDVKVVARYFEFYDMTEDKIHGQTVSYLDGVDPVPQDTRTSLS
ncbi:MAG TPA: aldehyde dehydrogenase family protein [Candidatus Sulfotelmatobacter sp.]|nr:aldehyde dehydrogenase family protein [Candidatus Sulfotelmatobacter sp.]